MAVEQYTESITLQEMKCNLGENDFGYVFPQGDVKDIDKISACLKEAGGKPSECEIDNYSLGGKGKAKPEFIITFNDDTSTIMVVECKSSVKKHETKLKNKPNSFAVDGVLYYSKFLKNEYNVISIAISGTKKDNMKVSSFYWLKGQDEFYELNKAKDIILEPKNYIDLIKGNKLRKSYSLDEIRETAIDMHNYLREIKVTERHKPIFIAGILIALEDDDFIKSYEKLPSFNSVIINIQSAIENVLKNSDIKNSRIDYIKQAFRVLGSNSKFKEIPLGHMKSITWYIEQLELKIKPMMDYADSTVDALGVFYHEFIKYSGGDGKGLGIVLTPQHLTEFMCELAGVNKNSKVLDICCGSGAFLVTAMSKMFKGANANEIENIRKKSLYGVEFDDELYTLAVANMIIRKDGKSNIYYGDCFNKKIEKELKGKEINIGLINPPYSQSDVVELEFMEQLLNIIIPGGVGVCVVPMSCALGVKFKEVRERLFKKHTLKAVFSMPDEIFYPTATNTCVMLWEAHKKHDDDYETFFGYYKDDGFVKRKKLGRIDANSEWEKIKKDWLTLYHNRDIIDGLSARKTISHDDEWLCEAYMKTDYSIVNKSKFQQTLNDYLAFKVKNGIANLDKQKFNKINTINLDDIEWKEFLVSDILYPISRGKVTNLNDLLEGSCPIVSAYGENQGISYWADEEKVYENCLTVSMNGSKTGYFAFHDYGFNANTDCGILIPKISLNKYTGLFISTILNNISYKYLYGRKLINSRLEDEIIKLPIYDDGKINLTFMESYIKSLSYGDRI